MTERNKILVINPNSTERITRQIRDAVSNMSPSVEVVTSRQGPVAIESDGDVAASVGPLLDTARDRNDAGAYVVACFSDPGLDDIRRAHEVPAYGIAESAMSAAMELADKVGVVSSLPDSIPRHARYRERLGIEDRVVGDLDVGLGVLELETESAYQKVRTAAESLVAAGAGAVVLGCTGMTHMQGRLEDHLKVPVIDPCRAAVAEAIRSLEPGSAAGQSR